MYGEFKMNRVTSLDVAAYILQNCGKMTAMKLQKLVYYCQAWSLVWDDSPMMDDVVEAWAYGPVLPELYSAHRGQYYVSKIPNGNPDRLNDVHKETADAVITHYGDKSSHWLSELTHLELPWRETRKDAGLSVGERGSAVIPHDLMAEYYSSLID